MDNRYYTYGCPAIMQDSRFITNYIRGRVFDQMIRQCNLIKSSQDYKLFLQQYGNLLITKEREQLLKNFTCNVNGQCVKPSTLSELNSNKIGSKVEFSCGCPKHYDFLPNERTIQNMCNCKK